MTMLSLAAVLAEPARRTPNKLAVVQGDLRLGYGELWRQARQHASALSARGVLPGDRVALLAPNVADFVRAYYGILAVGAAVVPVPTLLGADEAAYVVRHSGAQTLLYHATFAAIAGGAADTAGLQAWEIATLGADEWNRSTPTRTGRPRTSQWSSTPAVRRVGPRAHGSPTSTWS